MKVAVYTCITASYDAVKVPLTVDSRLDYYCFSDSELTVIPPWKFVPINQLSLDSKDQSRFMKMHPHSIDPLRHYDVTLYVDGSVQLLGDIYTAITEAIEQGGEIFLYEHFIRKCIYREAERCAFDAYDSIWNIAKQMRGYFKDGYPPDNGLFEANVIIRRNTFSVAKLMSEWWNEYSGGIKRDQLSLPYISWKLGIPISSLGRSDPRFSHRYFKLTPHTERRQTRFMLATYVNRVALRTIPFESLFFGKRPKPIHS